MSTNKVMLKFAKAGINLSPTQYNFIIEKYDKVKSKDEFLDMLIAIMKFNIKEKNFTVQAGIIPDHEFKEVITWEK